MPRDDRAHGVYVTRSQKGGNKRRKPSHRKSTVTKKTRKK